LGKKICLFGLEVPTVSLAFGLVFFRGCGAAVAACTSAWLEAPVVLWAVPGAQVCRRQKCARAGCSWWWWAAACCSGTDKVPLPAAWSQAKWSFCL